MFSKLHPVLESVAVGAHSVECPQELVAGTGPVPASLAPIKILVVDDEPANLAVLEAVFQHSGYSLVHASSGTEALLALIHKLELK